MAPEPGSDEQTVRLREGAVAWRQVGEEVVVLDLGRSTYLGVNRTGALLWPALSVGATRQGLVSLVSDAFDVDPAIIAGDIDAFLGELATRGLLEENRPS